MSAAFQVSSSVHSGNGRHLVFPKPTQLSNLHPASLKPIALAIIATLTLNGCVTTNPKTGQPLSFQETIKENFDSDDPCANNARNAGAILGGLAGSLIAYKLTNGKNKALATVAGGTAGAVLGASIGADVDRRRCELSKIQKKYGLDMQVTPIAMETTSQAAGSKANNSTPAQGNNSGTQQTKSATTENIGLSVSVVDRAGKPQFVSGSDELQPDAKEQFSEISRQYATDHAVAGMGAKNNEEKQKMSDELRKKRVLLIGHTDDTGNSKLNADLSERRAKSVAKIFQSMGVTAEQLFYQGAGETLPIADNATEEGRAKNRRVEIVDLSNEETFRLYLQNRRPNAAYYRPADTADNTIRIADSAEVGSTAVKPVSDNKTNKQKVAKATKAEQVAQAANTSAPAPSQQKLAPGHIDFGGSPVTSSNATVNLGQMAKAKQGFMLIGEAHASEMGAISSCSTDRPRNTGAVKSFKDDKTYATSEYLPGLYGRSWQDTVGGNLIVLNGVAVLRDGAAPANAPNLKVYANYNPSQNRNPKPDVVMTPEVNTYQGDNGLLYRVFTQGEHGMQCMDVLMPADGSPAAKAGKVIYGSKGSEFVSDFKPVMIR